MPAQHTGVVSFTVVLAALLSWRRFWCSAGAINLVVSMSSVLRFSDFCLDRVALWTGPVRGAAVEPCGTTRPLPCLNTVSRVRPAVGGQAKPPNAFFRRSIACSWVRASMHKGLLPVPAGSPLITAPPCLVPSCSLLLPIFPPPSLTWPPTQAPACSGDRDRDRRCPPACPPSAGERERSRSALCRFPPPLALLWKARRDPPPVKLSSSSESHEREESDPPAPPSLSVALRRFGIGVLSSPLLSKSMHRYFESSAAGGRL